MISAMISHHCCFIRADGAPCAREGRIMRKAIIVLTVLSTCILNALVGTTSSHADSLPIVPIGSTITGTMTLDPNAPIHYSIPGAVDWLNPGSITATIGGGTFAAPITGAIVESPPIAARPFWEETTMAVASMATFCRLTQPGFSL
jgi:hypothetical protein